METSFLQTAFLTFSTRNKIPASNSRRQSALSNILSLKLINNNSNVPIYKLFLNKYSSLLIATGRKSRGLNISNEDSYIGHGISFCASCDGALYKDKTVVVVGGANTAVTDALYLADICKKVYIIYRKDDLRAEDILKKRVKLKSNIEILYNKNITKYLIDSENITGVLLDDGTKIDTSCVFLAIGALPNSELFDVTKNNGYIEVDNSYQTSTLDVYACGDVIDKKVYQLVTASAEGIVVANSIIEKEVKERK